MPRAHHEFFEKLGVPWHGHFSDPLRTQMKNGIESGHVTREQVRDVFKQYRDVRKILLEKQPDVTPDVLRAVTHAAPQASPSETLSFLQAQLGKIRLDHPLAFPPAKKPASQRPPPAAAQPPDYILRYVKGPLKGTFADQAISFPTDKGDSFGHGKKSRFRLPPSPDVASSHAIIGRGEINDQLTYYLKNDQGKIKFRRPEEWWASTLKPTHVLPIEHGLEFKIGRHHFKLIQPNPDPMPMWRRPMSRRAFLGVLVSAFAATAAAVWTQRSSRPLVELWNEFKQAYQRSIQRSLPSSLRSRIQLGAYPLAGRKQGQAGTFGPKKTDAVHFVPHSAIQSLSRQSGVQFQGNSVFIRLNQASQHRWNGSAHFLSPAERNALSRMKQDGITPHFVIEPTEGLFNVPKYHATLNAIAKDVSALGPATVQFAPGLNAPRSPYYWKNSPREKKAEQIETVRKAFQAVHAAFNPHHVSLVFSPLLPHDPTALRQQSDEISQLAQTVKPYVSGAGGLFFPESVESVSGIDAYAKSLKENGMPFVGLDGFAARGSKPFDAALKRFSDADISRDWKYLHFYDMHDTLVEKGGVVSPWYLTDEKQRMMRQELSR